MRVEVSTLGRTIIMEKLNILSIKIDDVSLLDVLELIEKYIQSGRKSYLVTPNPEIIVDAQTDEVFKKILNQADLSIPDGIGLKLANPTLQNRTTGTDLMLEICRLAEEKGFTIGLLGGLSGVAEKCAKRLQEQFPKLNIEYVKGDIKVDNEGRSVETVEKIGLSTKSPFDILFVAFGHKKQEKWIYRNLDKLPVKVAIGVGGAFDYISGNIPRAPQLLRNAGLEWLFRLIIQPQRIKRQIKLLKFVWMCVVK